jgi:tRNA-(ms[2]io[6]A)-hydroxylase
MGPQAALSQRTPGPAGAVQRSLCSLVAISRYLSSPRRYPLLAVPNDDGKRRLPVLSGAPPEEPDEERPPWHWSAIGAVASFLVWLPLATAAAVLSRSLLGDDAGAPRAPLAMVGLHAGGFALGCAAGGFLVGRFGGRAGPRQAAVSGLLVAAVAWSVGVAAAGLAGVGGLTAAPVLGALGGATAWLGGWAGFRARRRRPS